jgi:hypothetical protein
MRINGALAVAAFVGVVLAAGIVPVPAADAQAKGKAVVRSHAVTVDPGGGVPVKVHCVASKAKRCKGSLRLVVEVVPGSSVSSLRQGFVVPGGGTKTVRIQAAGTQIERLLQAGTLAGVVKVKERKPRSVPVHSSSITLHAPSARLSSAP